MQVIDLTHTIYEGMPVFPGTPMVRMVMLEEDGCQETLMGITTHTGTHIDVPFHMFSEGKTLDFFDVEQFIGKGLVIDCSHLKAGEEISVELVTNNPLAEEADFLLFYTGWDKYWGTPEYFGEYPCPSSEIVQYIIEKGKKGIGLDTLGIDPVSSEAFPLHKQLLSQGKAVLIENLTHLEQLGKELFQLYALPLKLYHGDGAPVRAIAVLE